ncbi:MAG: hypothetical protein U9Q15_03040 [Patescibacteria group bacterium]|nr:hypothetical protein [Patescibacteria group bacterium]
MYIASQNIIDFPGFDVYKSLIQTSVKGLSEKRQSQTVGFLDLTEDIMQVEAINDFVGKTQDQYDTVIVFGVGGSALGARAFLQAYHGMYWNSLSSDQRGGLAQLYIIDNVDSGEVHQLLQTIDLGRTLINIVSKSGGTLETSLQSAYIIEQMKKSGISDVSQHVVVTTGKETPMETYAQQNNFPVFYIPENV